MLYLYQAQDAFIERHVDITMHIYIKTTTLHAMEPFRLSESIDLVLARHHHL